MSARVYDTVQNDPAVTALVADRVYWVGDVPMGVALPYVVLQTVYTDADNTLAGDTLANARERVQIDCYAESIAAAHQLRNAVRAAMRGIAAQTINAGTLLDEPTGAKRIMTEFSVYF